MNSTIDGETSVASLYRKLLDAWNRHSAGEFVRLFAEESHVIGFDGSLMEGQAEIEQTLRQIFADHVTARYVAKIRGVDLLTPETAVLRAVVGMVPPGQQDINPAVNAIQTLVALRQADGLAGGWRIVLFQNTPAQFHGRPDLAAALTEELRGLLTD